MLAAAAAPLAPTAGVAFAGTLHEVTVADNFFAPEQLTIQLGDTVRWTNAAGTHNVFSCVPGQNGCDGQLATESFDNGLPRPGLWIYSYTFAEPGENPYLCQSHASFMKGNVTVLPPESPPPTVPDGTAGSPMRGARTTYDGASIEVSWDDLGCGEATAYRLIYGFGGLLPDSADGVYEPSGAICDVTTPLSWNDAPDVEPLPGFWLWWLIVADDGAGIEGSWGRSTIGERAGPEAGGSGLCGASARFVSDCPVNP